MKFQTAFKRLSKFRVHNVDTNTYEITSRANDKRGVYLKNQDGEAVLIPYIVDAEGYARVIRCNQTIKAAVAHLQEGA